MHRIINLEVVIYKDRKLFQIQGEDILFDELDVLNAFCGGTLVVKRDGKLIEQTSEIEWRNAPYGGMHNCFHLGRFESGSEDTPSSIRAKDYQFGDKFILEFNSPEDFDLVKAIRCFALNPKVMLLLSDRSISQK